METNNKDFRYLATEDQGDVSLIDFKRVFFRILKNWYVLALCLSIALSLAFFKNRYADRIYQVSSSIMIKENNELAGGKFIYNNPLVNPYRNFFNELFLIQSYPLIESVVMEKRLNVEIVRRGSIKTTEVYGKLPLKLAIKNEVDEFTPELDLVILSSREYVLTYRNNREENEEKRFLFGEDVRFDGLKIRIDVVDEQKLSEFFYTKFTIFYRSPESTTKSYLGRLRASWAEEGASVIDLKITGNNPQKEIDFLNGLIANYQEYDLEKKNLAASKSIEFIENQLSSIRDSLKYFEVELQQFKNKNTMTDLGTEAARLFEKVELLESQRMELDLRKKYFSYLSDYLKNDQTVDQIILPSSVGLADPILSGLISDMIDIQMDLRLFQKDVQNPVLNDKRKRMNEIRGNILESISTLSSTEKIKGNYLDQQIKNVERQLNHLPLTERQLVTIKRNYSLLENLYVFMMQKAAEAGISKASSISDIVIVNPPRQSGGAIQPQPLLNYTIAGLIGIVIPFIIFIAIELFNNKIQSREDIEKITQIPFVGGIGHKKQEDNLVVFEHPKSAIAESFRALRSNLNYFTSDKERKVFMITSSISGEGKTFTTINLATVLAWSGKKTCIVGADMRRPKMFKEFNLSNEVGLSTFLTGMSTLENSIFQTQVENLWMISSGPVPPNPSELLLTSKLAELIQEISKRFDYVVIDTPPIALVTDALVLSAHADHSIFLVRQNYTPKVMLRTIDDFYRKGTLKNLSVLFNDIYKSGPGYGYGGSYGYGYGYYGYGSRYQSYYDDDEKLNKGFTWRSIFRRFRR